MADCTRRSDCRLCGSADLEQVLSLIPTPPANAFVRREALGRTQKAYPLDVFMCRNCGHVQLLDVVSPDELFRDYVYVSGTSPVFVRHFEEYAAACIDMLGLAAGDLVVDIGSNDGTLLRFFQAEGVRVLGVDPARDIARRATEAGVETWDEFFGLDLARRIKAEKGQARLVTANNVFAHLDPMREFVQGVAETLTPDGAFVFEVSYLVDVYEKTLFDTIYHEHLAYHTVLPLKRFFAANGMELKRARRAATHGGSLRGVATLAGRGVEADGSVDELIDLERSLGLHDTAALKAFGRQIDEVKAELTGLLERLAAQGKRIAGYGAPAKATTLMHHFGLRADLLDYIVDDSPLKQGLYTPGLHVPVVSSSRLETEPPDYLLVLAWNFAPSIIQKNTTFAEAGGRFIVPLPSVEVLPHE